MSWQSNFVKMLILRSWVFTLENREQITTLIKTFKCLSTAIENSYSTKYLWEQIDAFMIDAVGKKV